MERSQYCFSDDLGRHGWQGIKEPWENVACHLRSGLLRTPGGSASPGSWKWSICQGVSEVQGPPNPLKSAGRTMKPGTSKRAAPRGFLGGES